MKLELAILAGNDSKQFLADFTKQIDRLEKLGGVKGKASKNEEVEEEEIQSSFDDVGEKEETSKRGRGRPKKETEEEVSFGEEEEESSEEIEEEEEQEAPSLDDVLECAKATAKRVTKNKVMEVLKKKYKVGSIQDLKEKDYQKVIDTLSDL